MSWYGHLKMQEVKQMAKKDAFVLLPVGCMKSTVRIYQCLLTL